MPAFCPTHAREHVGDVGRDDLVLIQVRSARWGRQLLLDRADTVSNVLKLVDEVSSLTLSDREVVPGRQHGPRSFGWKLEGLLQEERAIRSHTSETDQGMPIALSLSRHSSAPVVTGSVRRSVGICTDPATLCLVMGAALLTGTGVDHDGDDTNLAKNPVTYRLFR